VKLIIEPRDGAGPLVAAIKGAKKSVEMAIFRFDHREIEEALKAAASAKGVGVTAVIAFANRGGEASLRKLEMRFLDAGIVVARSADDLIRYHGKYILIDRRVLYVLSFNFTHLDIDRSRGFGIVTTNANWIREAVRLFEADCTRTSFEPGRLGTFVVSPANSRKVLGRFLKRAKTQLLIYDPKISDAEMLRILYARCRAGVEIKVIGSVAGRAPFDVRKLDGGRLHTRTIICDRRQVFVGSQSLRKAELDLRREVGLIIRDAKVVRMLIATFESDWNARDHSQSSDQPKDEAPGPESSPEVRKSNADAQKAVEVLTKELDPLAVRVKKAVRKAVARAGEDVLNDKVVKDTMKRVVKRAVKDAVKEAVQEAHEAKPPNGHA
jgi:cardiolipin synthase